MCETSTKENSVEGFGNVLKLRENVPRGTLVSRAESNVSYILYLILASQQPFRGRCCDENFRD
jgi:hypothetical protein